MGPKAPARAVTRRDPRLLDFLASAKNAPLGELEFDVLTWAMTRWYQAGRPPDGRLEATIGEIAYALYGTRQGGKQYALVRQALRNLYDVSVDLTVLSIENGDETWRRSRQRRLLQALDLNERIGGEPALDSSTGTLQLGSWLVEQLDAHTVAAMAWQVLRRMTGISKRLAIYLAAHDGEYHRITAHTERLVIRLTEELYEEFGIAAARERDRRSSVVRAARRIAEHDRRYSRVGVERMGREWVLRVERPVGGEVLRLPSGIERRGAPA